MKESRLTFLAAVFCLSAVALAMNASHAVAQPAPALPAWMRPGIVVVYDTVSAFIKNGRFDQGIQTVMTTRVNSVSGNVVNGSTNVTTVGTGLGGTHAWVCDAAGNCRGDATGMTGQFWVDIAHPADSVKGANGEIYRVMGQAPYSRNGQNWTGVTLSYQNQASGIQLVNIFDAKTGLVLVHSETFPTEQVHAYFRTISGW